MTRGWNDLSSAPLLRSVWVLALGGAECEARGTPGCGAGRALSLWPRDPQERREWGVVQRKREVQQKENGAGGRA